jgi:hypothetical protein
MIGTILFLVVLVGLGLRLARWVDCLPTRVIDAVHPGTAPRPRSLFGLFGAGL